MVCYFELSDNESIRTMYFDYKKQNQVFLIDNWKEFLSMFNRNVHKDDPIEGQLASYFKKTDTKYLDKLGMLANPANHNKIYTV
jgi:hypothetical protein